MTLAMTSARADSASGVVRTRPLSHFSHSESLQSAERQRFSTYPASAPRTTHQLDTSEVGQTMMTRFAAGCPSMPWRSSVHSSVIA